MKTRAIATLSVLALATAFAPLTARSETSNTTSYDLATRQFDPMSAGEYDGRLRMHISSGGIVSGNFQDSDGHLAPVIGGLKGTSIWLQIGRADRPYNGTFVDGKLTAMASARGLHTWTLEGTPRTHY